MTPDNVVHMPTPKSRLADLIRADLAKCAGARQDWIDGTLALCEHLAEARMQFPSNQAFAVWLVENKLDTLNKDDRAAVLNMASDLTLARSILAETSRSSLQHIWTQEMQPRLLHLKKTDGSETTSGATKQDKAPPPQPTGKPSSGKTDKPHRPKQAEADRKFADAVEIIRPLVDKGAALNTRELQKKHNISHVVFEHAAQAVRVGIEGHKQAAIDVSILNGSMQKKFEALEKKLRAQMDYEVSARVTEHINGFLLPKYAKEFNMLKQLLKHDKPFTDKEYLSLLWALHEDQTSVQRRQDAFGLVKSKEFLLRAEPQPQQKIGTLPATLAEMMAMRKHKG
jgi:hypothetical protein